MLIYAALALAAIAALYLTWDSRPESAPQQLEQRMEAAPLPAEEPPSGKRVFTASDYASYDVLPGLASFQDFLQGGCIIYGETGSGKSSGPYRTAVRSILSHPSRPGFLVLAAKESVYAEWEEHTRLTNRTMDLVRFQPGETCDFLATLLSHPRATVRDANHLLEHLMEVQKRSPGSGGGDNQFFYDSAGRVTRAAITIARKAMDTASISHVHDLVTGSPTTAKAAAEVRSLIVSELPDAELKGRSFLAFCVRTIERRGVADDDVRLAVNYFLAEHHQTGDRQRAAVTAIILNLTERLISGEAGKMFSSGETSCSPLRITEDGAVVVLDMPLHTWGETGRFAQIAMKLLTQKFCLMRKASDSLRPVFTAEDEFATWALSGGHDSYVQSVSRESKLGRIACTQTLSLMRSMMGGDSARDEVAALAANLAVRVFASNSDPEVNAYASSLCGGHWEEVTGGSMQPGAVGYDPIRDMMGQPQVGGPTINWSRQWRPRVDPSEFNRLKRGGDGWVQALVFLNGRRYPDTDAPFTWTTFDQNFGREEGA